jgi:hypothetical protein
MRHCSESPDDTDASELDYHHDAGGNENHTNGIQVRTNPAGSLV